VEAAVTRVTRYVLSEILPLLAAGLCVIVLLFLLAALYAVLAPLLAKGAAPLLVAKLAGFSIPEAVSRGLPIALLFAVLLATSRLAGDAEIKSLFAAGLSPARLMWPTLGLALVVALLSFANQETLVPKATQHVLSTSREILLDNPRVLGLGEAGTVLRDAFGRAITVDRVQSGGRFEGVRIVQTEDGGPARELITAKRGELARGSSVLRLHDGTRVTFQGARPVTIASFASAELPVQDLQANLDTGDTTLKPVNLPLRDLLARLAQLRSTSSPASQELTALHRKFAEPLAALAFAFFGVTLALFTFRSGGGLGLVWVLMLTFAYYATWSVFRVMGEQGALDPALAAWAPDVLYVLAGLGLLAAANRR
jgi:lipopolysaccharide export system permease protein